MARALFLMPKAQGIHPLRPQMWTPKYHVRGTSFIQACADLETRTIDSLSLVLMRAPQAFLDNVAQQSDAMRIATPENADDLISAQQAQTIKAVFNQLFIPESFVEQGDTRRDVLRKLLAMFRFSGRMQGLFGGGWRQKAKDRGVTMQTRWGDFPQALKDEFIAVRDSLNLDIQLPSPPTLENILLAIAQEAESKPRRFGDIVI